MFPGWTLGWLALAAITPFFWCLLGRDAVFIGDALHHHYPAQAIFSRLLAAAPARLPLWNPWQYCGSPLLADPQFMALYPPALLYRLLPFPQAYGTFLAFHALLALTGMAVFLRGRGASPAAAGLGAIGFALGAGPACLAGTPPVLAAFSWLPWIACLAARLATSGRVRDGAALGLVFAWQALAGYPQEVLYGVVLAVVLVLFMRPARGPGVASVLAALGVALAASAAALIPFGSYLAETARGGALASAEAALGAAKPWDLLSFVTPFATLPASRETWVGVGTQWTTLHACGALALVLAVTAAAHSSTATSSRARSAMTPRPCTRQPCAHVS
ncbi:MAG: hypothetical protein AAB368_12475 [bacterium]